MPDVGLDQNDRDTLYRAVCRTYDRSPTATSLLRRIGYPEDDIPPFSHVRDDWEYVFGRLSVGVIEEGFRKLICEILKPDVGYPFHPVVQPLAQRIGVRCADGSSRDRWADGVLVVGASPDGASMIRADREMREVRTVAKPQGVRVDTLTAAAFADLLDIVDVKPDVLHLACHSDGVALEFAAATGVAEIVEAKQVVEVLAALRDRYRIRLHAVVLNCCYGMGFAQQFVEVAEVVVAHSGALEDECAIGFARELYRQLRCGPDIEDAAHVAAALAKQPQLCPGLSGDLRVLRR